MRLTVPFVIAGLVLAAGPAAAQDDIDRSVVREMTREVTRAVSGRAYQGRNRGQDQTERVSRKVRVGRDGRVSIANISGDIVVTAGGGDEVSIEAVKRTTGDRSELGNLEVVIEER